MPIISLEAHEFRVNPATGTIVAWGHAVYDDGARVERQVGACGVADLLAVAAANGGTLDAGPYVGRVAILWEHLYAATGTVAPPAGV